MNNKKNRRNPAGKRGLGKKLSVNPDGSYKTKLLGKQKELLKTRLNSRMIQHGAVRTTRSAAQDTAMTDATVFTLTPAIISSLVLEINAELCLYCIAGAVCKHKRNICIAQDVIVAFNSLTETAETTRANQAQKIADKANQLRIRRERREVAAQTELTTKIALRTKMLLARAVLEEANDWLTKVSDLNNKNLM